MNIYPDFETFKQMSRSFTFLPMYAELLGDLETPVSAFMKIRKGSYNFLLESAEQEEKIGRYSFIGTVPEFTVKGKGKTVEIYYNLTGEKKEIIRDNPVGILDDILARRKSPSLPGLPGFTGGLIGYFSYDFVRQIEKIPEIASSDSLDCPDFFFMFAKDIIIFDHFKRKIILVTNVDISNSTSVEQAYETGKAALFDIRNKLGKTLFLMDTASSLANTEFKSNFEKENFIEAVQKVKKHIKTGDIIQAVISQRWAKKIDVNPFNIYRALRSVNPSPYMFYLEAANIKMVGSSPEILVKFEKGKVTLRPIAGTRPRGKDDLEEKNLETELLADEKERAEHIMLVDLGRNDLGKICVPGSIEVTELMAIEKYSHVMHLVSNIEGQLKKGKTVTDIIKASFPAGTVSGAPKIRAMEIIEEVEPVRRGLYAGAVGYFSLQQNMDFCITIRTIVVRDEWVYIQAGAGIVADSLPEREYEETENKVRCLMEAYRFTSKI